MPIDIIAQDPVRLTSTSSTDVYEAPSTPTSIKVTNLRFGIMHDGASTNPVSIAIHHVSTTGTYGADTEVDRVTVSQGKGKTTRSMQIAVGGKIIMAADAADQITVNLEDGIVFS